MSETLLTTSPQSPRILRLQTELQIAAESALPAFWNEAETGGGPMFEPLPQDDPLAGTHVLVTFIWRAEKNLHHCLVFSSLGEIEHPESMLMNPLTGTDVWYRTYCVRKDVRLAYAYGPDIPLDPGDERPVISLAHHLRPDPMNKHPQLKLPLSEEPDDFLIQSLLEGPQASSRRLYQPQKNIATGKLEKTQFSSKILANERPLWVYTPHGYDPQSEPYSLLLVFDGQAYTGVVPMHTILDNLIAAGEIPPLVALLPNSLDSETRSRELPCHEPFLGFLEHELIPWARQHYNLSLNPSRAVVAGSSYGGLGASWVGLRLPHLFGNVLSQAGSYWWRPGANWKKNETDEEYGWLTRRYIESEKLPIRFYQEIGLLEHDLIGVAANRHFRDVLRAKGYPVDYREFYSGHDYACWRETLADGLVSLFNPTMRS